MKLKKLAAIALAGAMVFSTTAVSFAATGDAGEPATGTQTGSGAIEGVVDEDVYNAVLPTTGTNAYNYIVDPYELIRQTEAEKYSGATFGEGTVFFKNSDTAYSNTSNAEKIVNKSSKPLKVSVTAKATVTTASGDGVTNAALATTKGTWSSNDALEVYLGITDSAGSTEKALVAAPGVTLNAVLGAAPEGAYETTYDASTGYAYALVDGADEKFKFAEYSFQINGAANDKAPWAANTGVPTIEVTWSAELAGADDTVTVATPEQTQTPKVSVTGGTASSTDGVDFDVEFTKGSATTYTFSGLGDNVTLTAVQQGADLAGTFNTSSKVKVSGVAVNVDGSMWSTATAGDIKYLKVTAGEATYVLKVTIK